MSVTTESFYITGGTLHRDAPCYIERQADTELYNGLKEGRFCYVLTSRQMGKSSLMVRTANRLREEGIGVAVLDLTAIGQNLNPEQWYNGLLNQLGQRLDLEDELYDFSYGHKELGPLQRWMRAIREVVLPLYRGRVIIFVDEIDTVRSLPFSTDEFFAGIREFYNGRTEDTELGRLTFCLLGVATPSDLIRDTRTTPFNIGYRVELNDFTSGEALPLARGLRCEESKGEELLRRVLYWTGGNPYLTQRICREAAEYGVKSTAEIDEICERLFFSHRAQERDDNLMFVRERILRSEVDIAGLLELYKRVRKGKRVRDEETSQLVSILRLSGIVKIEYGYLKVRNRIYQRVFDSEWVKANMPDAELRRQRVAFYRGVLRTAAVAVFILAVISFLALNLKEERDGNKRLLYATRMSLANQAWDSVNIGRVQELLEVSRPKVGEEDLRGFEWYYLWRLCHSDLLTLQHDSQVASVAFSPDGKILAAGSWDNTVRLWDVNTWKELATLEGHELEVFSVAFSPDGKILATGSKDTTIRLWDVATQRELAVLNGHTNWVYSVAFSPDGKILATASVDKTVKLWDITTKQELATLIGHKGFVNSVEFSPDGKTLASASSDKTVMLWDTATQQEVATLIGHTNWVNSVAFSPDGKTLATGSFDKTVKLWDTATHQELTTLIGYKNEVRFVVFSPNGEMLVAGGDDSVVRLWNVATRQELTTIMGHSGVISSIKFSPDGKILATGSRDKTVKLWDLTAVQDIDILKGHIDGINSVAFSSNDKILITGADDKTIRLWDVATRQVLYTLKGHGGGIASTAFSPDGSLLGVASGLRDTDNEPDTATLWDINTRQEMVTFIKHTGSILCIEFSPDGKILATGGEDKTAKLWDLTTRKELAILKGHTGIVKSVVFSPNGKLLATGSYDKTVKLWDLASRQELVTLKHGDKILCLKFSPDGKTLAIGGYDGTIELWDIIAKQKTATLKGHTSGIWSVAFSNDGKNLASGSADNTVKLWNVATKQEVATLKGHKNWVISVAFSHDGKILATGSNDSTVKLWRAATEEEVLAKSRQ
jgi:WD40 repeat protein